MCLGVPGRVIRLVADERAIVDLDGAERVVSLAALTLDGRAVAPGTWVMVHTGFAVEIVDTHEAVELVSLRRDMRAALQEEIT